MAERYDNTGSGGEFRRRSPSRVALSKARQRVERVSTVRKLLMTLMVLGAMTTAVGAGTFASLNASTTNASSTFQTGSLVLSDQVSTGTTCFSTGGGTTDTNSNTSCSVIFDATSASPNATDKRPGEYTQVTVNIQNGGTVAGKLTVNSGTSCASSAATDQVTNGTTSACNMVQLGIQDAPSSGTKTCLWGDNMTSSGQAPYITGSPLVSDPTTAATISLATYNQFNITVNGTTKSVTLTATTYSLNSLISALNSNSNFSAVATASYYATTSSVTGVAGMYELRFTSKTTSGAITVNSSTATPSATALSTIGFMDGGTAAGGGQCATGTGDQDHSLAAFYTAYQATGLTALNSLTAGTTEPFVITAQVPGVVGDQVQGNMATFDLTWTLTQS